MENNAIKIIRDMDHSIREYISNGNDPKKSLNFTQFRVLAYLFAHQDEEVCQKDLEVETNLKKASITGVIDYLESKDLVKREVAKDDKRRNIIALTEKTRDIKEHVEYRLKDVEAKMIENINKEDLDVFFKVMNQMYENIRKVN